MKKSVPHFIAATLGVLLAGCATDQQHQAENYPYVFPLVSPGVQFSRLPFAVQRSVRAEAGAAEIFDILKSSDAGETVFTIVFANDKIFPPLYLKSDGTVLYPNRMIAVYAPQNGFSPTGPEEYHTAKGE